MTLLCKACCRSVAPVLRWAGVCRQHVKATCPDCGAFIKFAPQTPEVLRSAGPRPLPPAAAPGLFGEDS